MDLRFTLILTTIGIACTTGQFYDHGMSHRRPVVFGVALNPVPVPTLRAWHFQYPPAVPTQRHQGSGNARQLRTAPKLTARAMVRAPPPAQFSIPRPMPMPAQTRTSVFASTNGARAATHGSSGTLGTSPRRRDPRQRVAVVPAPVPMFVPAPMPMPSQRRTSVFAPINGARAATHGSSGTLRTSPRRGDPRQRVSVVPAPVPMFVPAPMPMPAQRRTSVFAPINGARAATHGSSGTLRTIPRRGDPQQRVAVIPAPIPIPAPMPMFVQAQPRASVFARMNGARAATHGSSGTRGTWSGPRTGGLGQRVQVIPAKIPTFIPAPVPMPMPMPAKARKPVFAATNRGRGTIHGSSGTQQGRMMSGPTQQARRRVMAPPSAIANRRVRTYMPAPMPIPAPMPAQSRVSVFAPTNGARATLHGSSGTIRTDNRNGPRQQRVPVMQAPVPMFVRAPMPMPAEVRKPVFAATNRARGTTHGSSGAQKMGMGNRPLAANGGMQTQRAQGRGLPPSPPIINRGSPIYIAAPVSMPVQPRSSVFSPTNGAQTATHGSSGTIRQRSSIGLGPAQQRVSVVPAPVLMFVPAPMPMTAQTRASVFAATNQMRGTTHGSSGTQRRGMMNGPLARNVGTQTQRAQGRAMVPAPMPKPMPFPAQVRQPVFATATHRMTANHASSGNQRGSLNMAPPQAPIPVRQTHMEKFWTQWTGWSGCSQVCGSVGHQVRYRKCSVRIVAGPATGPASPSGCMGGNSEHRECNVISCQQPASAIMVPFQRAMPATHQGSQDTRQIG